MSILMGPTGGIIKGHVLDVDQKKFEEAMRFSLNDPYLYTRWNPKKFRGWGCWEIRRRPEMSRVKTIVDYKGASIVVIDRFEMDIINHVLDCAFLNYDQIRKLKKMDMWQYGHKGAHVGAIADAKLREVSDAAWERGKEAMKYANRHFKKEAQALKDHIVSGGSLGQVIGGMGSAKELE